MEPPTTVASTRRPLMMLTVWTHPGDCGVLGGTHSRDHHRPPPIPPHTAVHPPNPRRPTRRAAWAKGITASSPAERMFTAKYHNPCHARCRSFGIRAWSVIIDVPPELQ